MLRASGSASGTAFWGKTFPAPPKIIIRTKAGQAPSPKAPPALIFLRKEWGIRQQTLGLGIPQAHKALGTAEHPNHEAPTCKELTKDPVIQTEQEQHLESLKNPLLFLSETFLRLAQGHLSALNKGPQSVALLLSNICSCKRHSHIPI